MSSGPPTSPEKPTSRAVASPPQGSLAQPGSGEVVFEGIAKHSASLGGYVKWGLVSVLGGAVAIAINTLTEWPIPGWVLALLWLIGTPGLLWTYLEHISTKFKVTGRRIETEVGVITKRVESLELWRVLDVKYSQSLVDRVFNNATITLVSTDQGDPELALHGLPDHRALFERLRDAVQDARQTNRPMELVGEGEGIGEMV